MKSIKTNPNSAKGPDKGKIVNKLYTVHNRTVLKNGSCCTVRSGKGSCLQKFRHFWMIIRDLFFESGSKIKKILQRYVIYISDQITVPYLNTETSWMVCFRSKKGGKNQICLHLFFKLCQICSQYLMK